MDSGRTDLWGTNVPISMPAATKHEVRVPMEGFCFTPDGIAHDLTETDLEEVYSAPLGPETFRL